MDLPDALLQALRNARRVMVLTGAGVSAESGLATFRDKQVGLWERFDPMQLATSEAFARDPDLVWGWYEWRRMQIMRAQPNPGHIALTELATRVPELTLVTQNIDDLHERAGSTGVVHLHGKIAAPYCMRCQREHVLGSAAADEPEQGRRLHPPRCAACGGTIRPGVVWFGEALPREEWQRSASAAGACDMFLCIGTSALVFPAASLLPIAARGGAVTVQVNPAGTQSEALTFDLKGPSGVILPALVRQAWPNT